MVANKWLMLGCASLALVSTPAGAQAPAAADEVARTDGPITQAADIVVIAGIGYRDRTDTPEPVLKYGTDYFQRFEPLTAGDALKRVPSVTFLSDVIESDAPRLRGLPPGYTQILING
ncbi:MAG: Plug domain-containing protein, partial [Alphaproteobacteria bacterium]|nr:Plug domain-containing protein [Alphaproteobacteria bacterium]